LVSGADFGPASRITRPSTPLNPSGPLSTVSEKQLHGFYPEVLGSVRGPGL
jgi:hypothetical protein